VTIIYLYSKIVQFRRAQRKLISFEFMVQHSRTGRNLIETWEYKCTNVQCGYK